MKISAIVLSKKPDLNHLLLESLSFVDEILIIVDLAPPTQLRHCEAGNLPAGRSKMPCTHGQVSPHQKTKIFYHPLNNDFSSQRNFGLQKAKGDWVLFVDDDEYVGTELKREIIEAINLNQYSGFILTRQDLVFHQPLRHGETGNTKILRLAKRTAGKFVRPVHERWGIKGRVGELSSPLYHTKDGFVSEFISRMDSYGQIDSKSLKSDGKPFSWFRLMVYPIAKFKLNYFFRAGFLDGSAGLFQAYLMAVQSLSTRVFQWENEN
ncbi:TPA: hypothetical protein DIU27_00525 [Candidatus Collierbacteria bacterium]|uniref:Glycosyl transferase family 2 n=1 Tax=Candidatus Collierbacteria bacterium GW2011_GWB2_44_22 TaxID=1618387 RepID=A0A0G1K5Q0_9BACT|nr:MAG: Glycosyl transferase family 2 [Candidatus Collierbacteria bacterium GW2011_GWA2_44_13]KKT49059.1 MAG: Glycosyl transferase family 2 [Candidatus Collierbacteria bacterium GW2011_GWB1_44_197]KKT51607.1 MAG: Glycosyl transferase family 2 [Candidatus Collierbacteria bacterium GW2011_GWB2_44_22]KKT63058.1 MAG: Glycosyl transferase family 2 [Candidatus Collierbacteria bacterium GW2011_GWD1_44_27]KKT66427.1 MAG: Glycosyl transferase family 2 [Candidatus Collierbacteria bacterium GW2011_GWC2_44